MFINFTFNMFNCEPHTGRIGTQVQLLNNKRMLCRVVDIPNYTLNSRKHKIDAFFFF